MADIAVAAPSPPRLAPLVFAGAVFTSAALVFLVEPMVAKSILPLLGGSPSVWNACMAFFQIALLAGYLYAHLLQRLARPRTQLVVHLAMLGIAALFLPIEAASAMGAPPVGAPTGWLFRILLLSVGMPFAVLSATAPLLQSWYARASHSDPQASNPYTLYAASNLGSMLALLSYPTLVEPLFPLSQQRHLWAGIYVLFCAMIVLAGALMWRGADATPVRVAADDDADAIGWGTRAKWVGLAALPSSLMLGVTTYISNDIASVPLFWVIPLALYLLTFVIAFQAAPLIGRERALLWQAVFVPMAAGLYCIITASLFTHLFAYLGAFFLSALVCHQGLARSRPHPKHLTEFYLLIAFGGVVGGVFNAFVAPVIFHTVLEFPLVLVLCCLARPASALDAKSLALAALGIACAVVLAFTPAAMWSNMAAVMLAGSCAILAGLVSANRFLFTAVIAALIAQRVFVPQDKRVELLTVRSFFGVHRVTVAHESGRTYHLLFHGTTVHGAQPQAAASRCTPTTYYASAAPMGQVYAAVMRANPRAHVGVIGLGAGTLATYARSASSLRFFEIDPEVARIAQDPAYFTYLSACAKVRASIVLGDARLTMAKEPAHALDLLLVDAFSADNIPTHLLTTQAFAVWFHALKPGGLLMLHLSNRNLALEAPAAATAKAVGAVALMQNFAPPKGTPEIAVSASQVMLLAKSPAALATFAHDKRWRPARDDGVRPWTDEYTNIVGPLVALQVAMWRGK